MQKPAAEPASKPARAYRSQLRATAAARTRATILAEAMRLFLMHGYGKVTVNDIAAATNLAVPTVYASTGGKSAILSTLVEERQYGNTVVETTLAAVRTSQTAQEVIAATAHGTRVSNERYHDIVQVMVAAAAVDDAATEILVRSDEWYRKSLSHIARRLKTLGALRNGVTEKRALDILWFLFGRDPWHLLVADRCWSWDDAQAFLEAQARAALTDQP